MIGTSDLQYTRSAAGGGRSNITIFGRKWVTTSFYSLNAGKWQKPALISNMIILFVKWRLVVSELLVEKNFFIDLEADDKKISWKNAQNVRYFLKVFFSEQNFFRQNALCARKNHCFCKSPCQETSPYEHRHIWSIPAVARLLRIHRQRRASARHPKSCSCPQRSWHCPESYFPLCHSFDQWWPSRCFPLVCLWRATDPGHGDEEKCC